MRFIKNIKIALLNPLEILRYFLEKSCKYWRNDSLYIRLQFYAYMGYKLDIQNPKSYNEKLQWLKLYDRNPLYHIMVDKSTVKSYVANIIGQEYIIPTINSWENVQDINWDSLPNKFVLKTSHGGGGTGVVICKDKNLLDKDGAIKKLERSLNTDLYLKYKEWVYNGINKVVLAESLLEDTNNDDLHDYKVLCFNGEPKLIEFHSGRFTDHQHQEIYDTHWNLTTISQGGKYTSSNSQFPKPKCLDKLIELSRKLSKNIPHVRVDWYVVNNNTIKFSELTFFDASGYCKFDNYEDDLLLGSWITVI